MTESAEVSIAGQEQSGGGFGTKLIILAIVASVTGALYWQYGDALSLEYLATKESQLKQFQQDQPILVYGIAFAIYVAITGLSLPGAAGLTLLMGWYFGLVRGVVLVSFASTAGATIAFLMSRYFFQDAIQAKFGDNLKTFNKELQRNGAFYLFSMRLVPLVPFFVINAVMGLTPLRVWTFWWVSQIGMLAGTAVYVFAGSSVPDLATLATDGVQAVISPERLLQLTIAFAVLASFPFAIKFAMGKLTPQATNAE